MGLHYSVVELLCIRCYFNIVTFFLVTNISGYTICGGGFEQANDLIFESFILSSLFNKGYFHLKGSSNKIYLGVRQ